MPVETTTQRVVDFLKVYTGEVPVYRLGRKVGYINFRQGTNAAISKACNATAEIVMYSGELKGDPSSLYTIDPTDFFGIRKVPLTNFCLHYGIIPAWVPEDKKSTATQDKSSGAIIIPDVNAPQDNSGLPAFAPPANLPVLAAVAALGLGLVMMMLR
jgi:hypothetical protein